MNVELLKRMLQISQQMAETRHLDRLLQLAMEESLAIVGAERGYLVLLEGNGDLQFRVRIGNDDTPENGYDDLSRSIFNDVVRTASPMVITDALSDKQYQEQSSVKNLKIRSVMCVPLIVRGQTIGAIYVENRTFSGAFREEDLEPFIFFANQAAASIANALLIANLEQRVAERTAEVERGWQEAIEANKMRTTLLGQLSHDMRTPASIISFALSTLAHPKVGTLNEEQLNKLERAHMGLDQMVNLIENVFDLTKLELQSLEVNLEPTDLNAFLALIYDIGSGLPWTEAVRFLSDFAPDLPQVNIDPVRIQQVVMNLLSNALKFTAQGEVVLYATVEEDGMVHIGVRDTGEGIPEDAQAQVFERFQQFDVDAARKSKGAGLGLAICRELVEQHGGRIQVSSTPAVGSDFVFMLPADSPAEV